MAKIPDKIGKYKIVTQIAKGGMSAVYKGVHPTLKRFVTLKKLTLRGRSTMVKRFNREARIMMDFKNDHIAQVYDHFKEGPSYYIVEEFIDGISMDQLIKRERYLPSDISLLIFRDCCKALKYAHDKNVVHRDIKPGNILISGQGEVKLVDFGIAANQEEDETTLTREGMTLGTPSYMSPEQIENTKGVDKRADIYSMGVMLYEMVTGKTPFPGAFTPDTINRIQKGRYKPARKVNPHVSQAANAIIKKAIQPKARRRYQDLDEVFRILNRILREKDPISVQERIRSYIDKKDTEGAKKAKAMRLRTFLLAGMIFIGALAAASGFLYQQGSFHEWLKSREYGALIISAKITKDFKEPGHIYIQGILHREKDNKNTKLDNVTLRFRENKKKETEEYLYLESQKVYLKTDHYRIKVNLENKVFWETLYLESREIQKTHIATAEARIVHVILDTFTSIPLNVHYTATDEISGKDITGKTTFSVYLKSKWVKANRNVLGTLETGNVYRFKFEGEGYYPKLYHLIIAPHQSELDFKTALIPIPGTLRISSNTAGIRLLINGSGVYLAGGSELTLQTIEPSSKEARELLLPPGDYLLTAEKTSKLKQDILLKISSGEKVNLVLDYNKNSKSLNLAVQGKQR